MRHRAWTDTDMVRLGEYMQAGVAFVEIAVRMNRSEMAIRIRAQRWICCPIDGNKPIWGRGVSGGRYWTRERVEAGLCAFVAGRRGTLPSDSGVYANQRTGNVQYPPAVRVTEYFGTMANAWKALGVPMRRYTRLNTRWTQEDDDYLLAHAGEKTLQLIAKDLNRTYAACKRRLYDLGSGPARDVAGFLSALQVAKEYDCPIDRVRALIDRGQLPAHRVMGGHYWRIDPEDCEKVRDLLTAPRRRRTPKVVRPTFPQAPTRYAYRQVIKAGRVVGVRKERVA